MSKVVVVGVDHFLQNVESLCITPEGKSWEEKQKGALSARLEALIFEHKVQLVAEEAKLDRDCVGKQLADAQGCRYCNLTMPWEERAKQGIGKDYDTTAETREAAYRVFERFMFDVVQEARQGAASILIICGSFHLKNVAELFANAGDEVLTEDTAQAGWYRGRPMESAGAVTGFYKEAYDRMGASKLGST